MKDLIKYLLLGAGAFVLYNKYTAAPSTPSPQGTEPAPAGPAPAPANPPQAPAIPPTSPAVDLASLMRAAAGKPRAGDLLTFDQWNYMYSQVRGVPGPAFEEALPGLDRSYLMNLDEWKAAVAPFGI